MGCQWATDVPRPGAYLRRLRCENSKRVLRHESVEGYEGHFSISMAAGPLVSRPTPRTPTLAFFDGLPNNQCEAEHTGDVIKGKVVFRDGDAEEVFETGTRTT